MKKYEIDFQLASTHIHRQNTSGQAIITYKNHFIYGFSMTDQNPIRKCYRIHSQGAITLNLLRNSRVNPALSAYAYLFFPYDFNISPMEPHITRVVVYDKPVNRISCGRHVTLGWYIGPCLDHYRCMHCYMPATVILRITDTLRYIPKVFDFPKNNRIRLFTAGYWRHNCNYK